MTRYPSPIIILLIAFTALGLAYSATTPVFEAPDEVWHYNYVRYVAEGHGLPSLRDNEHDAYQEAAQPPLYYVIAALVTAPVRDDDKAELIWHNPGFGYQAPGTVNDNKNMLVHTAREGWPWHDFTLALHLARLVSLAFGTLTVWATWKLAGEAIPGRPGLALAAAGVVALTPQFVFMSGVVSNDSAAAALSTAALWRVLDLGRRPTPGRAALTGVLIGLAGLTKTSTLLLWPLAALSLFWATRHTLHALRSNLQHHATLAGATLAVGGWWYARNVILYGDALGLGVHVNTPWGRPQPVSLVAILPELPRVYRSFWGAFGWGGIEMPAWVYVATGLLIFWSLAGWLLVLIIRSRIPLPSFLLHAKRSSFLLPPSSFLLPLWCLAILVALLRWMMQVEAPHGRLLFPAIGAWAILLVLGWATWGRRVRQAATRTGLALWGALALASPFLFIRPALWPPPVLTEAQVYARADAIHRIYGGQAELLAWRPGQAAARPGDVVPITLCWRALQPLATDYSVFVHFLGPQNLIVGARDTWPGLGRFPTSLWQPGQAFCDIVRVRVEPWTPAPAVYGVEVGLYDARHNTRLEAETPGALPVVGRLIVRGEPGLAPQHAAMYDLGGEVRLVGYSLQAAGNAPGQVQAGRPFSLTLHWQAQAERLEDYTVFVHIFDETGRLAAQHDAPPRDGAYPTSVWAEGEIVADTHSFTLPAGLYALSVGMYRQPGGARLPVRGPGGPVQNDVIPLAAVQVMP